MGRRAGVITKQRSVKRENISEEETISKQERPGGLLGRMPASLLARNTRPGVRDAHKEADGLDLNHHQQAASSVFWHDTENAPPDAQ